jgi:hypothetical protein
MSLIKVLTEVENQSTKSLPAKIVSKNGEEFTIKYLSPTTKRDQRNRRIYSYEDETYVITDESVTEYTETDSELYFGFKEIAIGEFIKYDSDDEDEDFELEAEEEEEEDDEDEDEDLEEELDEDFDEE